MKSIELLAPAKDLQAAVAAVDYGADALYIGGARFGARHAAGNSAEEIARAVEYAHQYGVREHATLNTLLYDGELAEAERQARELIAAGVDALIVQNTYSMGYFGVESAYRLLAGQDGSVEKSNITAVRVITRDNMFAIDKQKALFPFG